jgi:hypothetical protein
MRLYLSPNEWAKRIEGATVARLAPFDVPEVSGTSKVVGRGAALALLQGLAAGVVVFLHLGQALGHCVVDLVVEPDALYLSPNEWAKRIEGATVARLAPFDVPEVSGRSDQAARTT